MIYYICVLNYSNIDIETEMKAIYLNKTISISQILTWIIQYKLDIIRYYWNAMSFAHGSRASPLLLWFKQNVQEYVRSTHVSCMYRKSGLLYKYTD